MERRIKGVLSPKASGSITITENGNYDVVDVANAVVEVKPSGTIEITENGEHDVANYEKANVNVQSKATTLKGYLDLVKTMQNAFENNKTITDLTTIISYNDTENVTSMNRTFRYCENLENLPRLNTRNCVNFYQAFYRCYKLEIIDLSYFYCKTDTDSYNMCYQCNELKYFVVREFGEMYVLGSNAFVSYTKILVPRAMVETLKTATNWSYNEIFALEDYTIDGTTTGELDESKLV